MVSDTPSRTLAAINSKAVFDLSAQSIHYESNPFNLALYTMNIDSCVVEAQNSRNKIIGSYNVCVNGIKVEVKIGVHVHGYKRTSN